MAVSESYRDFVLEQLGRVASVTAKRMFGGVGIYSQGLFFALIAEDRLYFKVDDSTRPDFERLGMDRSSHSAKTARWVITRFRRTWWRMPGNWNPG
jgi:TfoX/Sxy family transcriptional regulator of competence genes